MMFAVTGILVFLVFAVLAVIGMVRNLEVAMAKAFEDLKAKLVEINTTTDEIASDIQTLIDKLNEVPDQGLTMEQAAEISGELDTLRARLSGVAAEYTPATPPAPPADPGPSDQGDGGGQ